MDAELPMRLALEAAWKYQGLTYPNPAVGSAVCGARGELLSVASHQRAGGPHAEVLALKNAYRLLSGDSGIDGLEGAAELHAYLCANHNGIFRDCTIYVTLEPCAHEGKTPSCARLIGALGLKRVVMAHRDPNPEAAGGAALLGDAGIEVDVGMLEAEAETLLAPFVSWQRDRFVFFKWAQRLDGTIDGGTISCEASRKLVHALRDRCDLLVIGGNTVATDRPTLDARLVGGRAPDVLIYSRRSDFDPAIPLFHVPGRKVTVSDSLESLRDYRFVMIEGGPGMFAATEGSVDAYLCFVAPQSGGTIPFTNRSAAFSMLHAGRIGDDAALWLKGK